MPAYGRIYAGDKPAQEKAKAFWVEVMAHLTENGFVTKLRLHTIDRYVRARVEWERLARETRKDGPVTKTKKGNEQFSYKWAAKEKLEDRILKFERELLITPAAVGATSEPKKAPANDAAAKYGV